VKTLVIAIGGNSLITNAEHMSVPDQYAAVVKTVPHLTDLLETGHRIVITHGNGPQVGFILLRSEHSRGILHQVPLDSIVADTQGALGYQIQQALENELVRRRLQQSVATVVTQTLVNRDDPAFASPSKPIGEFYTQEQAEDRMQVEKWTMMEDAGRGWRRVVASQIGRAHV
jgi:carbamate kinase